MIETLILGVLAVTAAAVIGYFYGKNKKDDLFCIKKYGWDIIAWQGGQIDRYFVAAQKENQQVILAFRPDGSIDFDYDSTVKKHGE